MKCFVSFVICIVCTIHVYSQPSFGFTYRPLMEGVEVLKVFKNGPAEKAGLKAGDIITSVNNIRLDTLKAVKQTEVLLNAPVNSVFIIGEFGGDNGHSEVYKKGKISITKVDKTLFLNKCLEGNCADGTGTYIDLNGAVYTGSFKKSKKEGVGKLVTTNGSTYDGNWKDDKKDGKGNYTNKSSVPDHSQNWNYDGEWSNDKMDGKGKFIYWDGSVYTGDVKDNLREGKGILVLKDGDVYEGDWKKDMLNGKGSISLPNGNKRSGNFVDSKLEGDVIVYTKATNVSTSVVYKNGMPQ